jgi:excisionase family DNA binding protein
MGTMKPITSLDKPNTVLPSEHDTQLATESSRILSQLETDENEFRVRLDGGVELRLPSAVLTLLRHLLTEMSRGNAVTIIPTHAEMTTQEAANFLNVSRPHLVSLLTAKKIPFHKVGTHRRIRCEDLAQYQREQAKESKEALAALAAQAQEENMGY